MSYPDDPASSATPFGGESGIFGDEDPITSSPTTSERVVDTQSGYLVVLRRVDGSRMALSVKRRLGTPPSSSIVLTPDEQVKLAKILAEARVNLTSGAPAKVSPRIDRWLGSLSHKTRTGDEEELSLGDAPEKEFARVSSERVEGEPRIRRGRGRVRLRAAVTVAAVVVVGFLFMFYMIARGKPDHAKQASEARQAESAAISLEGARIDHFVRSFVSDMLDFDSATYKVSQIHAMSVMTPALMERYWKETSFPLSKTQLRGTPKGQTLIITKVTQEPGPEQTTSVDLFAELASANSKISAPVHLQLKVGYGTENQLRILDQKDLSATK